MNQISVTVGPGNTTSVNQGENTAEAARQAGIATAAVASITALGPQHLIGAAYLREFSRLRRQLLDGDAVLLPIVFGPGDSYTQDDVAPKLLARRWKDELGNGGFGWTGVGFPPALNASSNATKAANAQGNVDPDEISLAFSGTGWTGLFTSEEHSPDLCCAVSSTAADKVTFTYTGSDTIAAVKLHHIGNVAVRYRWNGGSWTALTASSATGAAPSLASVPAGAWTLEVEVVSGTFQFAGISGSRATGVVVHDIANNGAAVVNWANYSQLPTTFRADHAAALARLGSLRVFVAMLGANDQGQQFTADQYEGALEVEIDQVLRVAAPGADILWVMQPENGRDPTTYPMRLASYAVRAKAVAADKEFALLDLQPLFGATYAQYGDTGTHRQLFEADDLHPNLAGGALIWSAIENALTYRC